MKKINPNRLFKTFKTFPSKAVLWVSLIIITTINISYENWNHEYKIIAWDVNSYYAYLPMVFIYNDPDMDFIQEDIPKFKDHYWTFDTETGKKALLTTCGMSYLFAPFFLAGHGIAQLTPAAGDEFSPPYKISLIISCLFYLAIGLFFLRKVLLQYYTAAVTSVTLLLIIFGTNLLHYVTDEPTMSHAYSFALISVFLFMITKWMQRPGIKYAILLGALAGLISLIRPSNILILLLLFLWEVSSFSQLWSRIRFYFAKFHITILMFIGFILVWIPQFFYWHYVSGSLFLNTYGSSGQGFFFDNPQIYHLLFSYRKGWFVYTPMMLVAVLSLYFLYKKNKGQFWPISIYLALHIYVFASWYSWWTGGSFGLRSFIDLYGVMALPLAALIAWTFKQKRNLKIPILLILALILYVNVFQTAQYKKGVIHNKAMTKKSYWLGFMDLTPPKACWDNLVYPDYMAALQGIYYPETEIPWSLERKVDMKGWEYLNFLKDSILKDPSWIQKHKQQHNVGKPLLDSIAQDDAMIKFRKKVEEHKKQYP